MRILVTGSAGHLGEGLMRTLAKGPHEAVGIDILNSAYTTHVGTICDLDFVTSCMEGVDVVMHTATLHKPHVATHSRQDFVDTNITGTLNLLEAALKAGVRRFIFTSTTSVFGAALVPEPGQPTTWITEDVRPIPKNIYGVTKNAAEDLCHLFHRTRGLNCLVLRTSRFFPEEDDNRKRRDAFSDENLKVNEFLHRRLEVSDAVSAHLLAADLDKDFGFGVFILSATTPFRRDQRADLRDDTPAVLAKLVPEYVDIFKEKGWNMYATLDRVYDNTKAREILGWQPRYDFRYALERLAKGQAIFSDLAAQIGKKGYHAEAFEEGPFPVEPEHN